MNCVRACWNSAYTNLFGFNKWECVKASSVAFGRLDLQHILMKHHMLFDWQIAQSTFNFCRILLWFYFSENFLYAVALIVMLNGKQGFKALERSALYVLVCLSFTLIILMIDFVFFVFVFLALGVG